MRAFLESLFSGVQKILFGDSWEALPTPGKYCRKAMNPKYLAGEIVEDREGASLLP
jgi:hypothetical protein